jgi:hypothetical protein
MGTQQMGFGSRLGMALKVLFDGDYASQLAEAARATAPEERDPAQLPAAGEDAQPAESAASAPAEVVDHGAGALQLLALLQREGRLVDFLHEDVSSFSDEEVGGAARVVHEGCGKVLAQYVVVEPLRNETEGGPITVEPGFDPQHFRLTGDVKGEPPYLGVLAHPGWRALEVKLPQLQADHDPNIVAPAEVEL